MWTVIGSGGGTEPSPWRVSRLTVGNDGDGTLVVSEGGVVDYFAGSPNLGAGADSIGTIRITGPGSSWQSNVSGGFNVGTVGGGELFVEDGGEITTFMLSLGSQADAWGNVVVDGADSLLHVTGIAEVGNGGSGTVTLTNGGTLQVQSLKLGHGGPGTLNIGAPAGSAPQPAGVLLADDIAGGHPLTGEGSGTVVFNHTDRDYVFDMPMTGDIHVDALAGTTTLAGTHSYTGGTTVAGSATLRVGSGATIGDVTLLSGGTLGGTGTVGTVTAGGRVAPGNSIGTLSTGPITFQGGSVYAVEIAADGTSDRLQVSGRATIQPGAAVEVTPQAGSYVDGQRYTIIATTGGVQGDFDGVDYAAGKTLTYDLSLETSGNDVVLQLDRNDEDFGDLVPDDGSADGLDDKEGSGIPRDDPLFQALYALTDPEDLEEATKQLSGSGTGGGPQNAMSSSQTVLQTLPTGGAGGGFGGSFGGGAQALTMTQFALGDSAASDLLSDSGLGQLPPQRWQERRSSLWLQGIGGFGSRDGGDGVTGQDRRYAGLVGGLRGDVTEDFEVGLALSRVIGRTETDDGLAKGDTRSFMGALHGHWTPGRFRLDGALGLARHEFESERRIVFPGFDETATGDHVGWELVGDLGASWDWERGAWTLTPMAGVSFSWLSEESWSESGAGSASLSIDEADTVAVLPRLGGGFAYDLPVGTELTLTPQGQVLWIGRFGDRKSSYNARFTGTTTSWTVPGLDEPEHSAAVGLGAELSAGDWSLGAGYAGRFASGAQDHGFLLGGALRF